MKEFDEIKTVMTKLFGGVERSDKALAIVEKHLIALNVLIEKQVNIHALLLHLVRFDSPAGYNALVGAKYQLTQQEYDLFKEVMLYELEIH